MKFQMFGLCSDCGNELKRAWEAAGRIRDLWVYLSFMGDKLFVGLAEILVEKYSQKYIKLDFLNFKRQ